MACFGEECERDFLEEEGFLLLNSWTCEGVGAFFLLFFRPALASFRTATRASCCGARPGLFARVLFLSVLYSFSLSSSCTFLSKKEGGTLLLPCALFWALVEAAAAADHGFLFPFLSRFSLPL